MELTASQLRAVDLALIQRDTCVVAGPGSGKTAVLVECYRRLVMDAGIEPTRLLAITFTERAARSMKQKLANAFQDSPERRRQLEQASVSTVHGFCARLLRENAIFAGVDPQFTVLEARDAARLQTRLIGKTLDALFESDPAAMRALMGSLATPDFSKLVLALHEGTRSAGVEIPELGRFRPGSIVRWNELADALRALPASAPFQWTAKQKEMLRDALESREAILALEESPVTVAHFRALAAYKPGGRFRNDATGEALKRIKDDLIPGVKQTLISEYFAPQRETILRILADFDSAYAEAKRQQSKLDFSDLESFAVRLLEQHEELRREIQSGFAYVLMDELQDTNGQQAKLLTFLRPANRFYAVGDINQSIYGFRHANPDVFRDYRDDVSGRGHLVELEENWRSRDAILRATLTVLQNADGIEPRNLIARRALHPKTQPSVEVIAAIAPAVDNALEIEAAWVARRIRELEGELALANGPAKFGDMALLLRNLDVLPAFTQAFDDADIPYLVNQGKGFFETREVLDLTHLLRLLDNPRDEISLAAVLRSPFAAVSDEALLRLKREGDLATGLRRWPYLDTATFDSVDRETLGRLREQLFRWRAIRDTVSFDRLLLTAMEETGYSWQPGTRAAANIEKFLALARSSSSLPLSRFVEDLEEFRTGDPREPDPPPEDAANAVRMMTIHAAKGLEFPIVFLGSLHKGVNDTLDHLSFSPDHGFGVRWCNPETGEHEDDWFQAAIREDSKRRDKRESNRLLYVAMTRAEEHLVLSLSASKGWGETVEAHLGLDLSGPQESIKTISAPDGSSFEARIFASDRLPERWGHSVAATAPAPVEWLEKPERRDQHDSTASVTDVALFADCPRRYYLARYLKFEPNRRRASFSFDPEEHDDEQDEQPDATELGTQVHRLLAGTDVVDAHSEAHRLAQAFRNSRLGQRAARASRIEREWDFLVAVEDVVVRGQIDLWFEEAGEVVLVDYKTAEVDLDNAEIRAAEYASQLWLYALALQRATGRAPDHAYVYFPRADAAIPIDLRPTLFNDPQTLVREFRDAQSRLEFPLREAERCRRCPYYRGICPAGTRGSGVTDVIHPAAIDSEDLGGDEASFA